MRTELVTTLKRKATEILRRSSRRYRQIVEPTCRVFYRYERSSDRVFVLYVLRGEMPLRKSRLIQRDRENPLA